ncbi:hypothetical protein GBAR_LOCUS7255 [Geodia barretti]|uniref:SAM domain-containing protein n=1 Tax=Geodia barretti TaxID=519541 RepID=A0AA35RIC7_GEOBA|nr:hypothetical protein GBAR_LOCUS7255 [Geodia barretti]
MPKKYTKADVENWSVEEVKSWLHSKKLTQCLPDFDCVSGYQLLGMTNDDLKALPSVAGSEKKRKALKKAVGQLPGNSISAKTVKSKGKPAKDPPPVENFPPASFEPVPAPPPLPPPSSFHHPPHSPNSATYSDPSLIWGDEDQPQDIYDNAADAREEMLAPPLPPHPGYHQQQVGGGQDGGYGQDDDQMIYDQYEEGEEEEMFDSSFASEEEEEEEEEEPSALNGLRNANQGTEANIRAIRAKFFAEGLRAHTGNTDWLHSSLRTPGPRPRPGRGGGK